MKKLVLISTLVAAAAAVALAQEGEVKRAKDPRNLSLKLEIQHHIDRGIAFLESKQNDTGSWGDPVNPALTGLPVSAIMGNPDRDPAKIPPAARKGYEFLLTKQHPDGGIYEKGLYTYNTSLSLMALVHFADQPGAENAIRQARRFLVNQQADVDKRGVADSPYDGGIGYGGSLPHSDLSNTHFAIEALYYSKQVLGDRPASEETVDLNWDAAIEFVSRCQNLETNDQPFVKVTAKNKGGFVYYPGDSKAGEEPVEGEPDKVALRSYGSMSYAGLLSFIYSDMDQSDQRIVAVKEWLRKNYSVDENPGLEAQGLFYYYHTMAKALAITGAVQLELADGRKIDWREDLATKLFDLHAQDGSWTNKGSNRWWEDDPMLVTSYAILALEHISRQL